MFCSSFGSCNVRDLFFILFAWVVVFNPMGSLYPLRFSMRRLFLDQTHRPIIFKNNKKQADNKRIRATPNSRL